MTIDCALFGNIAKKENSRFSFGLFDFSSNACFNSLFPFQRLDNGQFKHWTMTQSIFSSFCQFQNVNYRKNQLIVTLKCYFRN